MSERRDGDPAVIELAVDLAEPPHTVWRALSVPAFRDRWLPPEDLACAEPAALVPGRALRYRLREAAPPFLESTVTFHLAPNETGGTWLRIVHELTDARTRAEPGRPANANGPLMRAA